MNRIKDYEAHSFLGLGVLQCSTLMWHSYCTCQTTQINVPQDLYFFFGSKLFEHFSEHISKD